MINDLGVDPYEWFDNPLDSMPIAREEASLPNVRPTFGGCYNYEKLKAEGLVIQDPPAELMEVPTSVTNPKPEKKTEVEKTPHHIAYDIATSKYNPFAVGGSESIQDLGGGSEIVQK